MTSQAVKQKPAARREARLASVMAARLRGPSGHSPAASMRRRVCMRRRWLFTHSSSFLKDLPLGFSSLPFSLLFFFLPPSSLVGVFFFSIALLSLTRVVRVSFGCLFSFFLDSVLDVGRPELFLVGQQLRVPLLPVQAGIRGILLHQFHPRHPERLLAFRLQHALLVPFRLVPEPVRQALVFGGAVGVEHAHGDHAVGLGQTHHLVLLPPFFEIPEAFLEALGPRPAPEAPPEVQGVERRLPFVREAGGLAVQAQFALAALVVAPGGEGGVGLVAPGDAARAVEPFEVFELLQPRLPRDRAAALL
mmetsp:Transcript_49461/g.96749  ORF Transcript_49461/g.96749 Transcript_49461/m.96749 type:complete len:305 (+) Transcript_49461:2135-3049(+)